MKRVTKEEIERWAMDPYRFYPRLFAFLLRLPAYFDAVDSYGKHVLYGCPGGKAPENCSARQRMLAADPRNPQKEG